MVDELEELRYENSHLRLQNNLQAEEVFELEEDLAHQRDRSTRWRGAYRKVSAVAAVFNNYVASLRDRFFGVSCRGGNPLTRNEIPFT